MGGLSCGGSCAKYILFFFNFIFFLVGVALLATGLYIKLDSDTNDLLDVLQIAGEDDLLHTATILVIVVGALIFVVGFFGCCGACQESTCMLFIYAFLVGLILVLQVVCAIMAAVFKGKLGDEIKDQMAKDVNQDFTDNIEDPTTRSWSSMQYSLKCCGSNGPDDYKNSNYTKATGNAVPETCCKLTNSDWKDPKPENYDLCKHEATAVTANPEQLHSTGCYYELKDYLEDKAVIIIGVAIALAVVEIVGIILACCLRKEISGGQTV